jgi:hypothetical protein
MKKIYASLITLITFFQLNAQFSTDWSRSYVGNGGRIYNKSFIAADATDNAVVSFGFDVIDSLSSTSIPFSHPGGAITVKYSGATGTQTYIKNIEDKYTSLAGQVLQTAGSVTVALTNQSAGGNKDIRVYRYASAGTQTWLHTYNGPGNDNDFANDIALDLTGNALVCGTVDADNTTTRGLLVYKLNSANGNLLWQKNISSVGSIQNGLKVLTDGSSSVYTIYERITGSTKTYGVAGFLAAGTDLYNTSLTINGYTQVIFKDFSCDQSGNCYASFFGITNSNSYNLIVIKIDTNGIASNFLSTTLSGDANNANTRIKVEPNSAQILVAYDNLSNNSVELKRYNSSALEVWNNNKALSTLNDVCFGNGVTPNVFLLSTVSGTDGNDISITRYNGGSGAFIGNTNYDIPLSNSIDKGLSINVSGSGNIFTSGTSSITQNGEKVFATRFNATATNQWTKSIVDFSDLNNSISRTSSGEIIVGGNSRNSSNVPAAYVTKYSSSGNELWRFQHGTYSNEINTGARQIASDSNGNIYFAGVETNSNRDIFLFKLNSSGRVIWKSVYNHTSNLEDLVSEIALDNLGNIILVGTTRQTSINRNVLVLKYNSSGNLIWNVSYDGPFAGDDFGRSLVINSSNEIYVGCELRNSGSQTDAAIIKLDASGNVVWTSINNDNFGDDLALKIRLDNAGNPILLSNVLVSTGSYNGNIYKVSPSNSLIFSTNFGDNAVNEIINDFSLNSLNQIAVTGQSGNSPIDRNIFTARFSEVGLQNWISTFVGAGNANDFGHNCSISNNGTVYCGGTTKNASSNDDFILLCYDGSGTQQHFFNFGSSGSSNEQASQLVFTDTKVFATGFSNSAANNDGLTAAFTLPILTNTAPTISTLATQTICTSVSSNSISITIADEDLNSVVLTGSSSNTSLISNSGLSFGGSGANRTLIITPAINQTGSSTITVTATDNGSLTNQIQFLVNVTGGPAATSIIADGAETFCNGQSVNIIVPPQTGVNYQWLQNGNNVGLNQNTINVSSSGTYSVVLSNNCSSITSSNSIAVSVNNPPSAPTISANGNTTFCTGGSVELSVPSASLVNYQWKIDGNNIGSNSNSLTATSAGVYTVELSNNCGTVASSNSISVIVNSAPTSATISANGSTTICSGNNVDLSVTSQTGVNYQWKIDGSNTGINSNLLTATAAGVYTVELSNNCGTVVSTNSISVIVNSAPTSATISANGSTTICSGSNVEFSVPSQTGVNYQWKIDGNNTGSNSNLLTATAAGVYTVELSNNCGTVVSTNSISVIVNSAPASATISANGSTTICSGSNVEFSVPSQTGVNYQWKIDGNNTGSNSNLLTATSAGVYTVELSNNCGTVVSANSISVIVNSAPTAATISANGSTTICSGSSVDLSVSNQSGVNYQWKLDGNNTGTNSNVLSANSAGVYSVVLSNNCGTVAASNTIEVVITTSPLQPTITALGLTEICQGDSVELFVPFDNSLSYQWQLDGNNIFTDTNSVYALIEGIYSLQVTNSCGSVNAVNVIKIDVTEFPIPQTIIANGPNNFCEGGSVLLSTDVIAGVTNLWFLGIDNVGDPGNELIATQSGTYSMVSINLCGIEPSLNTIEVNVTLLPVAPTIVSSSSEIPCNGGSVELSVINQTGVNYSWQQNGNIVGTNSNVFNATTAGTFTVDVSNSCGTEVSNNSITLTAPSLPQAQTITANGSTNFCQGNSVELSVPTEIGASYAWFLNGNTFAGNTNLIVAELPGVYTLEISNNCGISPSNNSVNVNVTQAPIAFNIVSSGNVSFCENESVILSTELQSGVTYQWLFNGNNIGTNSNSITASSEGIYTLDVSNNCGTESSGNSIQTTVIPLPISATISINGNTSLCGGETSTLSVPNQAGVNYQWKKDGTNVGTNDNTFDVNEAGIYTIEISNACGTVSSINNIEISITPEPIAQTISTSGSVIFCNGGSVELSVPLQVGVSYQWKLNGNNINGNLNSLTASQEGTYSLEISNSCGVVNTLNSILVTILNGPNASIISANGPTTICLGNSVDLSVINQTGVTYQWQIDGNNIGTNSNLLLANQTGIYSLILSNSCGTINSINTIAVNVNSLPNDATIITNGSTTFCNGNSLELSVPFQSGVNFQWKLNGNNVGTNSEIFNATASGNYTIEISNDCGVVTSINSVNILVENTPNATAIIALGPTTFCQGGSVDLTSPLQSGVNYQWKLNGNNVGLNTNSYSASQAGVYTLEVFNSCSTLVSSNSIVVNLNFAPSAQTITANGSTTICSGSFVELSVPLAQFTNYQWKLNGNNIGANANTINATLAGLYTIELSNNCGTSASLNSIQVNVTVVSAAISASGATSFCNGGSVTLTANSGNSYSWSNSSTSQSINVTSTGSYSVTVSNNNCTATSEPIFINVLNVIPPTISASATEICNGTQAIISSNILPDYQSFAWSNGASGNSINVSDGGNYFVTVTTTSGCTAVSNNIAIAVVGPTAPIVSFTGSNIFCEGGSVTLNSNVSSGNNWYFNGVLIPGATGNTYVANQTGNYTSQLTGQGCVANSNLISVIVNPKPIASAGIASQNIGAVTFSNNSTNYSSSLWNFGDNTSNSSITNPFHQYLADGTYNVVLTVTNSCGSTSTEITVTILGTAIEELESQTNFAIYPNPFQSNITLSNSNSNSMVGIVTIFDATGKAISYESLNIGPGNNLQMNVENLAKGIYFIEVKTNEYNKTLKLLKQ